MKKNERFIMLRLCRGLLLVLICMIGCKKADDFPEDLAAQLPETTNYNVHKFVLDERLDGTQSPVVRWNLNGKELFMLIDTGARYNLLSKKGIKNVLPGFEIAEIFEQNKLYLTLGIEDNEYRLDPYAVFAVDFDLLDGMLGLDWMEKYNNFVFDYVNNRIDYNKPPITDYDIPMNYGGYIKDSYAIPFTFNGKEMMGIIDTGCYSTFVNMGIIGEEKNADGLYKVHNFSIGNVHYETMEIKAGDDVDCAEGVEWVFSECNILGYPCFKDHVIQLDFKNNVFRIK